MASDPTIPDFAALGLSPTLLALLRELGYAAPTPIQAQSIPPLLAGRDLTGHAKTGSGKTAAFAIPLLERLDLERRAVQALVLCPTRDLCAQVTGELRRLGRYRANLTVLTVTGGQPLAAQVQALAAGVHVVVATPGRLLDHLQRGSLSLNSVRLLVLDEADRMLDMGFRDAIEALVGQLPEQRQTALFSATFPAEVTTLSQRYQRQPERVEAVEAAPQIEQWRLEVEGEARLQAVLNLLVRWPRGPLMIFANRRETVDALTERLQQLGVAADRLHGGLEQPERELMMARFRNGSVPVLVATDVAARGLDISGLAAVINYELPEQPEVYVHRIGRTGRAGEQGVAVSLHAADERARIEALEAYLGRELPLGSVKQARQLPEPPRLRTLLITGGRKDKLRPGDILGALANEAGLSREQVGRIEVGERVSYVALDREAAPAALKALREGKIKGRRFRIHLPR